MHRELLAVRRVLNVMGCAHVIEDLEFEPRGKPEPKKAKPEPEEVENKN